MCRVGPPFPPTHPPRLAQPATPTPTPDMLFKLRWAPGELQENYEPDPIDLQGSMAQSRDQGKLEESIFAPLSALGCLNFDSRL